MLIAVVLAFILAPTTQPTMTFEATKGSVWTIAHLEEQEPEQRQGLVKGSRLELRQGSVELTTESGVTARVKAPADFTVLATPTAVAA